jgi:serine/threonine protein kinase
MDIESSENSSTPSGSAGAPQTFDKEALKKVTAGFKPGEVIADRYEVQKLIGRGGMGLVYLCWDRELKQPVALKTLLPQYLSSNHAVKRFVREVKAARQLNHPCIVKVYDARQIGPLLFYTMEYVDGISLFKWMRKKGRLGLGSTVRILSLLCHALEHAHQFTVHRDISPDNVMVLQNGQIKLLDFGLAKLTNVQSAFTMIGVSLGKQEYMAPEQRLSAAGVDHRADIYSLGVMFYQLLTGELPRVGATLTDLCPDLPKEANEFVEKAMAQSADERFQSARDYRLALAHLYKVCTGVVIPGTDDGDITKIQFAESTPSPAAAGTGGAFPAENGSLWRRIRAALGRYLPFIKR